MHDEYSNETYRIVLVLTNPRGAPKDVNWGSHRLGVHVGEVNICGSNAI